MSGRITRHPTFIYRRKLRPCMACHGSFKARFEIVPPTGRTRWLDHICPECKGSKLFREDQGGDVTYPTGPERGTTKAVKEAKGIENTDGFRLGWVHQFEDSE